MAGIFSLLVPDEIYPMASQLHRLLIKTHVQDRDKIEAIKQVVARHFDVDALLARLDRLATFPVGRCRASVPPGVTAGRTFGSRGLKRLAAACSRIAERAARLGGVTLGLSPTGRSHSARRQARARRSRRSLACRLRGYSSPHQLVVDEPRGAQDHGQGQQRGPLDPLQLAQGERVGDRDVLDLRQRLAGPGLSDIRPRSTSPSRSPSS